MKSKAFFSFIWKYLPLFHPPSCMSVLLDSIKRFSFPVVSDIFERICVPDDFYIIMGTNNSEWEISGSSRIK